MSVAYSQPYYQIYNYSPENGLANNSVTHIVKDNDGFMWVGTVDGLSRFDGVNFLNFTDRNKQYSNLYNDYITKIFVDHHDQLWIGTRLGGLLKYNKQMRSFETFIFQNDLMEGMTGRTISAIAEDLEGMLWLGTNDGLDILDVKTKMIQHYALGEIGKQQTIVAILQNFNGEMYVFTDTDLFKYTKGRFMRDSVISTFSTDKAIEKVVFTPGGSLLISYKDLGIFEYLEPEQRLNQRVKPFNANTSITDILFQSDSIVWLGTNNMGLIRLNLNNGRKHLMQVDPLEANSLVSNNISTIYEDDAGRIWVGAIRGGLSVIDPSRYIFVHYYKTTNNMHSLSDNGVTAFCEVGNNIVWIGTENGGINRMNLRTRKNEIFVAGSSSNSLSENAITSIVKDVSGSYWFASPSAGINKFDAQNNTFVRYQADALGTYNIPSNQINTLVAASGKGLWAGTADKGIFFMDGLGKVSSIKHNPNSRNSISSNNVTSILVNLDSSLWVGTSGGGLNHIDLKTGDIVHFRKIENDTNSISSDYILSIRKTRNGKIWIGTEDNGLDVYDPFQKKFKHYSTENGLPDNAIVSIEEDSNGDIWLGTNKGLCRLTLDDGSIRLFYKNEGLQGFEFLHNSSVTLMDGRMLFGGVKGFNMFHPDMIARRSNLPMVKITGFKLFNNYVYPNVPVGDRIILEKSIENTDTIWLKWYERVVTFEFAALEFTNPLNCKYAYMLENFDEDWIFTDANHRSITYTNIPPGKYIFKIKSTNSDGRWNQRYKRIYIFVSSPFWRTWWFWFLFVIGAAGAIYWIIQHRIKELDDQKDFFENLVTLRTAELNDKNMLLVNRQELIESNNKVLEDKNKELKEITIVLQQTADELHNRNKEITSRQDFIENQNTELYYKNRELEAITEELRTFTEAIYEHKEQLEHATENLMAALRYALTIQRALLPNEAKLSEHLEHFILFKPKEVVSGDFYWFANLPPQPGASRTIQKLVAVVDCTGHGVPGAFMSVVGVFLLNKIVREKMIYAPHKILESLNNYIRESLSQSENENLDGMDICLCLIEQDNPESEDFRVVFSGSKRPLFYFRSRYHELGVVKGDSKMIGGYHANTNETFSEYELWLSKGDILYLTTDGYVDQNNSERKKFGTRRFSELLNSIGVLPMQKQKQILVDTLMNHQGVNEQRDDITLLGIKL